jgi:hypothetical protein
MPYTAERLPFSESLPQSRCLALARLGPQAQDYFDLLTAHPKGLTDMEAADLMNVERSSINGRRRPLVKQELVYADGFRVGVSGVKNTVWKIRRS